MTGWLLENAIVATLLSAAVAAFVHFFRPRPAVSHLLWLLVLVKLLVPPLSMSGWPPWPVRMGGEVGGSSLTNGLRSERVVPEVTGNHIAPARPGDPGDASTEGPALLETASTFPWNVAVTVAWLTGGLLVGAFFIGRTQRFRRRLRPGPATPRWLEELVAGEARRLRLRPPPVAVVIGTDGPRIDPFGCARLLWPAELIDGEADRWRAVVGHELAHLKRRDHWVLWIELAGAVLWWWFPLFWWVRARMRRDAELACDAWAVATASAGERRRFAESLIALAARASARPFGTPGLAATPLARRLFERRLIMIVDHVPHRLPRWLPIGVLALVAMSFPSWLATSAPAQDREAQRVPLQDDDRYWTAQAKGTVPLGQESVLGVRANVGGLEIVPGQGRDIVVTARVKARKELVDAAEVRGVFEDHVRVESRGDRLVIADAHTPVEKTDGGYENAWEVHLRVEVPRSMKIDAHTGVGDLRIETGTRIRFDSGVGNARIIVSDAEGISGNCGVGDVTIEARRMSGPTSVKVGTGSVKATLDSLSHEWKLEVGVGDLELTLPQQVSGSFRLKSGIGSVDVPWGSVNVKRESLGAKVDYDLGQGPLFEATTGVGSIRVRGR